MSLERAIALFTLVWPVFSGLFNVLFRWKTDEQWVEFCERRPWGAVVVKFIRTAGLDPVGVVRAFRQFAETKQRQRDTLKPLPRPSSVDWAVEMDKAMHEAEKKSPPDAPTNPDDVNKEKLS